MEMFRVVLILRRVATTHMSALQAQSQVHPGVAHLQALFASVGCERLHVPNLIQMCTSFHANPPSARPSRTCNLTPHAGSAKAVAPQWHRHSFTLSTEGRERFSIRQYLQSGVHTASHLPIAA